MNDMTGNFMRSQDMVHYYALYPSKDDPNVVERREQHLSYTARYKGSDTWPVRSLSRDQGRHPRSARARRHVRWHKDELIAEDSDALLHLFGARRDRLYHPLSFAVARRCDFHGHGVPAGQRPGVAAFIPPTSPPLVARSACPSPGSNAGQTGEADGRGRGPRCRVNDMNANAPAWPALPYTDWKDSCATLHLWTQIVGKIRLAQTPWVNHSWHVPLYVTARGLTTSPIPYKSGAFEIEFDFIDHVLWLRTSEGHFRQIMLMPVTVADFYSNVMVDLKLLGIDVAIDVMPNEIPDAIPFPEDTVHYAYDPKAAHAFWRILLSTHLVLSHFRTSFLGKVSLCISSGAASIWP